MATRQNTTLVPRRGTARLVAPAPAFIHRPEVDSQGVEVESQQGRATIRIIGELDSLMAPRLASALADLDRERAAIEIDLCGCTYIDSYGLHALFDAAKSVSRTIICPPGNVRRVLDLVCPADMVLVRPRTRSR